jgi:hypothetical protein
MQSENDLLRQQISDLQSQLLLTQKIANMQTEINLLKQEIFDLKIENTRLNHLISIPSKQNMIERYTTYEISSSDEEYYSANEGSDDIDRYCKYCRQTFKYPSNLKRHLKLKNKCSKLHNQ